MRLRQIEAFRAVMVTGSMIGGAKIMRISQPAMSQLIAQLERNIGVALFKRSKGRLHATAEADILYQETERVYAGIKELEQLADGLRFNRHGSLRIAGFPAISRQALPMILSGFCQNKPDIRVSFNSTQSSYLSALVARQEVDIALSVLPSDREEAESSVVGELKTVCVLHSSNELASKSILTVDDLKSQHFVSLPKTDPSNLMADELFDSYKIRRSVRIETTQSDVACSFVAEGGGVSIVDELTVASYRDARLVVRRMEPEINLKIWLLKHKSAKRAAIVDVFIEYLKKELDIFMKNVNKDIEKISNL
ncbi:MAG: LysR substrate-binding domain-containing protein [Mesorhizobium sp.]